MHLVFVTSLVPDGTPSTGYEIANAAIIDALKRRGVRVTSFGFIRPGETPADPQNTIVLGELDPTTDGAGISRKLGWVADALRSGLTVSSAKLKVLPDETVRQALRSAEPFDGYVLNAVQMTAAYESLFCDKPSLYVAHNVEHISARENAATAQNSLQRLLFRREADLLQTIEKRLCAHADFVFTLAAADGADLGLAETDYAVLPLVTRPESDPNQSERKITHDAGLIGTWTWQPNLIGLKWFLDQVVPLLPDDFSIRVAGKLPAGLAENHPRVAFVGRVDDATQFIRSAAVVPLVSRAGTGVQLKTIETFELGLPSVATQSALRGIAHVPANCAVCDNPAAFAKALTELATSRGDTIDGTLFHQAQRAGLDAAISKGLALIGRAQEGVAA